MMVTCPDEKNAESIANALIEKKIAACVNIIPKIKSLYRWKNKIEKSFETLMIIKTKENLFSLVKEEVLKVHPYEVPEIVCLKIEKGYEKYMEWIEEVTRK